MVKKRTLPFVFDSSLPTRFGVLPRYAENEDAMRWFEVPAVMMFHVANAWQEGNQIKLVSCCFEQVSHLLQYWIDHISHLFHLRSCSCWNPALIVTLVCTA